MARTLVALALLGSALAGCSGADRMAIDPLATADERYAIHSAMLEWSSWGHVVVESTEAGAGEISLYRGCAPDEPYLIGLEHHQADNISIYQCPTAIAFAPHYGLTWEELLRRTVLHELGHHFGYDHRPGVMAAEAQHVTAHLTPADVD